MEMTAGKLGDWGSSIAGLMFIWATFQQFFPEFLKDYLKRQWRKLENYFNPTMTITFNEYSSGGLGLHKRSAAYTIVESYLSTKTAAKASHLKAEIAKDTVPIVLAMDDYEQINDVFNGVNLKWFKGKNPPSEKTITWGDLDNDKKFYTLSFNEKHRELITGKYINFVMEEGKANQRQGRQRKVYMNYGGDGEIEWEHAVFEHPASFSTFAMDEQRKEQIVEDLITFSKGKQYYAKIGKVWKRGYLLYGPPGTGKSTMIVAMANLLGYDIYDLELTTVMNNTDLKRLLINIKPKSLVVIEDIDCSLDLTGKRKSKKGGSDKKQSKNNFPKAKEKKDKNEDSKVTLSGLLNFIDGIWSGCAGERIVVFTTNHVDQLDPALIRRGRMDMHIELGYCTFGAFRVLAKNYLNVESHPLFGKIEELLGETNMTPADVAENLTPKSSEADAETCLKSLIQALEKCKEESKLKEEQKDEDNREEEEEEKEAEQESEVKDDNACCR